METTERRRGVKYMEGYLEVKESSKVITAHLCSPVIRLMRWRSVSYTNTALNANNTTYKRCLDSRYSVIER